MMPHIIGYLTGCLFVVLIAAVQVACGVTPIFCDVNQACVAVAFMAVGLFAPVMLSRLDNRS